MMESLEPGDISYSTWKYNLTSANPWEQDSRSVSNIRGSLILAEQMGLKSFTQEFDTKCAQMLALSSTSKLITAQKKITEQNKALQQVKLKTARLSWEKDAAKIFHHDVIGKYIIMVNQMCTDLDLLLKNMHMLIHRLQKPFVGDHIKIDAAYHRFAKEVFVQLVPTLNNLVVNLDNITWAANNNFSSSQLEPLLVDIQSQAASVQTKYYMLSQMKSGVEKLTHHAQSSELDASHESAQTLHNSPSSRCRSTSGNT